MMKKHVYIRRDGNGGFSISKPLALIIAVLTLLSIFVPAVAGYGALNEKVVSLEKTYNDLNSMNRETFDGIQDRIIEIEKTSSGTEVSLNEIEKDIGEIKSDIRELIYNFRAFNGEI